MSLLRKLLKFLIFWEKPKRKVNVKTIEPSPVIHNKRKGGYRYCSHVLRPLNCTKSSVIYKSFRKQKLPGCSMLIKKVLYRVEINPHFAF